MTQTVRGLNINLADATKAQVVSREAHHDDRLQILESAMGTVAAVNRFIADPVTKQEGNVPRIASVVGGPQLRQEPDESNEAFNARVMAIAHQCSM